MSQPARWLWGLVPLLLLWGASNLMLDKRIEHDVARRAEAAVAASAGSTPGARPAFAQVIGRDVTISGEVLSADGAGKAMTRLRGEPGVRRVLGGLSQVVAQKPYSWFASRQPDTVTLGGFVPDIQAADDNVAAVKQQLPGAKVDDRQSVAFGAPEGFGALAKSVIAALPRLENGRVSLDDQRLCIEGVSKTPEDFLALQAGTEFAAPGYTRVACALEPPTIVPYRWSLARSTAGGLSMQGFYPDAATREKLLSAVQANFASVPVADELKPGAGAPSAFIEKVTRAARDLARLREGRVAIDGDVYTLSGKGPDDHASCESLKIQIAQQDGPDSVARVAIDCPPAPPLEPVMPPLPEVPSLILDDVVPKERSQTPPAPPEVQASPVAPAQPSPPAAVAPPAPIEPWSAELQPDRIILSGTLRDQATRAAILAEATRLFPQRSVEDRMTVVEGSGNAKIGEAAGSALAALAKLQIGRVAIRDGVLSLSGHAADPGNWQALRQVLSALPDGLRLSTAPATVPVRPYELSLSADRSGIRLAGALPDEAARRAVLAAVAEVTPQRSVDDATALVPGAPAGWGEAAKTVLTDLLRLDIGSATMRDDLISVRGLTCRELIASEVETSAKAGLPAGFTADVAISPRQTGCVIDPPASCQNDLDGLTKQNPVLFAQGTSVVTLDPTTERVIAAAASILQKCPGSHVTIEGHANRDGEWRGFDNRELSLRRAERVRDELARRGIDPSGLDVKGYGTTRPLLPHGAPQSREMNRRVQFTVAK